MRWDCPNCLSRLQFSFLPLIVGRALVFAPILLLLTLADFAGRFSFVPVTMAVLIYLPLNWWILRNFVPIEIVDERG